MTKINEAVNLLIGENPLYTMMLRSNVVNYSSLAKTIREKVEGITGKEVKVNTIVKCLTEISPSESTENQLEYLRKSNLSLEYKYAEKIQNTRPSLKENTVLVYRTGEEWKILSKDMEGGNLALIRIQLPLEAAGRPGITLFVVEYLLMHRIEVDKIYRFGTEILLVCNQEKADIIVRYLSELMFKSYL